MTQNFDPNSVFKTIQEWAQRLENLETVVAAVIPQAGIALTVTEGVASVAGDVESVLEKVDPALFQTAGTAQSAVSSVAHTLREKSVPTPALPTAAPADAKAPTAQAALPALPKAPEGMQWTVYNGQLALMQIPSKE